jgi:hypothetical protein
VDDDDDVLADRNRVDPRAPVVDPRAEEVKNNDPVDEHDAWEEDAEVQDDDVDDDDDDEEEEDIPEVVDEQDTSQEQEIAGRRDKRVHFIEQTAAVNDYPSLPALYRVVREDGASVWNVGDGMPCVIRTIPFGVVVLCKELKEQPLAGDPNMMLRIPDGWIPEDSVLHVHSLK